jgi:hypothetical protein
MSRVTIGTSKNNCGTKPFFNILSEIAHALQISPAFLKIYSLKNISAPLVITGA